VSNRLQKFGDRNANVDIYLCKQSSVLSNTQVSQQVKLNGIEEK